MHWQFWWKDTNIPLIHQEMNFMISTVLMAEIVNETNPNQVVLLLQVWWLKKKQIVWSYWPVSIHSPQSPSPWSSKLHLDTGQPPFITQWTTVTHCCNILPPPHTFLSLFLFLTLPEHAHICTQTLQEALG